MPVGKETAPLSRCYLPEGRTTAILAAEHADAATRALLNTWKVSYD
ncbi:hypothetical protein ACFC01_28640 [Streptomyces mirabilis]